MEQGTISQAEVENWSKKQGYKVSINNGFLRLSQNNVEIFADFINWDCPYNDIIYCIDKLKKHQEV